MKAVHYIIHVICAMLSQHMWVQLFFLAPFCRHLWIYGLPLVSPLLLGLCIISDVLSVLRCQTFTHIIFSILGQAQFIANSPIWIFPGVCCCYYILCLELRNLNYLSLFLCKLLWFWSNQFLPPSHCSAFPLPLPPSSLVQQELLSLKPYIHISSH